MEEKYPKAYLKELAHKWKAGTLTQEEQLYLDHWYDQHHDDKLELPEVYKDKAYLIKDRIVTGVITKVNGAPSRKTRLLWRTIAAAAVILITLSAGVWFYFSKRADQSFVNPYANDVAPGKNSATLTLANGHKIVLSDAVNGQLAKEAGVVISKTANGQLVYKITGKHKGRVTFNTLSTANGEQYEVILPDLSKIWLNASSSVKFPATFAGLDKRTVVLSGEAYFEVAKDKAHPFVVKTTHQQVQVLGTHFNISSYPDEVNTKTTLLEGSVRVVTLSSVYPEHIEGSKGVLRQAQHDIGQVQHDIGQAQQDMILKPGQQSILQEGHLVVNPANIAETMAWKNGYFRFEDEPLESVMKKITRWYNVEVIYAPDAPKDIPLGGFISRSKNISAVLEMMTRTGNVKFKVDGRRITVMKY